MVFSCLDEEKNQQLQNDVLLGILLAPAPANQERHYQKTKAELLEIADGIAEAGGLAMIAAAVKSCHSPSSLEQKKHLAEIADVVRFAILQHLPRSKDEPEKDVQALQHSKDILDGLPGADGTYARAIENLLDGKVSDGIALMLDALIRDPHRAHRDGIVQLVYSWPKVLIPMVVSCLLDKKNVFPQYLRDEVLLKIFLAPAPASEENHYRETKAKLVEIIAASANLPKAGAANAGIVLIAGAIKSCQYPSFAQKNSLSRSPSSLVRSSLSICLTLKRGRLR